MKHTKHIVLSLLTASILAGCGSDTPSKPDTKPDETNAKPLTWTDTYVDPNKTEPTQVVTEEHVQKIPEHETTVVDTTGEKENVSKQPDLNADGSLKPFWKPVNPDGTDYEPDTGEGAHHHTGGSKPVAKTIESDYVEGARLIYANAESDGVTVVRHWELSKWDDYSYVDKDYKEGSVTFTTQGNDLTSDDLKAVQFESAEGSISSCRSYFESYFAQYEVEDVDTLLTPEAHEWGEFSITHYYNPTYPEVRKLGVQAKPVDTVTLAEHVVTHGDVKLDLNKGRYADDELTSGYVTLHQGIGITSLDMITDEGCHLKLASTESSDWEDLLSYQ